MMRYCIEYYIIIALTKISASDWLKTGRYIPQSTSDSDHVIGRMDVMTKVMQRLNIKKNALPEARPLISVCGTSGSDGAGGGCGGSYHFFAYIQRTALAATLHGAK